MNREQAKAMLYDVIKKSRVHLYKPIQIAEILYRDRVMGDIDLGKLEDYRTKSKDWRDRISIKLLGRRCTSSSKFQDDLFNAIPPEAIVELGKENRRTNGGVEAYIYMSFLEKHTQLKNALDICLGATKEDFYIDSFLGAFWHTPGLKRSLDKIFEIVVYSLFHTLLVAMDFSVEISINKEKYELLEEFREFTVSLLGIDFEHTSIRDEARVYRVGVTNAADRGLDMYSNWGPVVQIKHLTLDEKLAEDIVSGVMSDRIVIVCKDAEQNTIMSLLNQLGWKSRIQSIITEKQLFEWYELACRGKYSDILGNDLLSTLSEQIALEFPSSYDVPEEISKRGYENLQDAFWYVQN